MSYRERNFDSELIKNLLELIQAKGDTVDRSMYDAPMPDEKDRVFYKVALSEPKAKLVIGNAKHYPVSPIVETPTQFCELLGM